MAGTIIQQTDLESTFRALRNQDPAKLEKQSVPYSPDYKAIPSQNYAPTTSVNAFGGGMQRFAASTASAGIVYGQPQFFSPVHTPINWQIPSKRLEIYQWCRFFYENEPKVASSIDFYSSYPMNDYEHECKEPSVKNHFDKLKKKLELSKWLRLMSHEIHKLGDCFPFIEIECEHCHGVGRVGDEICEHEGGTVRRIVILNPDYVEVYSTSIDPEPMIALKPDEELINMVQRKTPGYERLTPEVRALVSAGQPIYLDNRNVSHLMYGQGGYNKYGVGMVRRLFPILSYKTKLMVAQWIVAERLIVPIKIVKVGSDERPAGPADIAAVQSQLAQTANDPNLTIVTHHAFELNWEGAAGKVLTLSNEFEFINQEILDGMMINNALLNGEGPCYHPDVEILTENGWKYYDEVFDDEKLGTFNPLTGELEFQDYLNKIVKHYDDEMVRFKTNKIEMLVTKNHRMYVRERTSKDGEEAYSNWKVVAAENVKYRSKFRACVEGWKGDVPEEYKDGIRVGKKIVDIESFIAFVGYYISEGWANQKQAGIRQKTLTNSEERIRKCLSSSGLHFNDIPGKDGMTTFNFRTDIARWLCKNIPGKSKEKKEYQNGLGICRDII